MPTTPSHSGRGRVLLRVAFALLATGWAAQAAAEVVLTPAFTASPTTYTPGATVTNAYVLTVTNSGDVVEDAPQIDLDFPSTVTWTCTAAGTGSTCGATSSSGNALDRASTAVGAGGGVLTYTFTSVSYPSSQAGPLTVTATVVDSETAADADTTTATAVSTRSPITDFGVTFSPSHPVGSEGRYTPGTQDNPLSVTVTNHGPSDSAGATLTMPLPVGVSATWSCAPADACGTAGSWSGSTTISLAAGASATLSMQLDYPASASAASIDYVATIDGVDPEPATDPHANTRTNRYLIERHADFGVAVPAGQPSGNVGKYIPGTTANTFQFSVSNAGPSNSTGAALALTLPFAVDPNDSNVRIALVQNAVVTCNPATACGTFSANASGELRSSAIALPAGQSVSVLVTFDYPSSLLEPTATFAVAIDSADVDATTTNDSDSESFAIDRRADIAVQKLASQTPINPGTSFHYDITVTNNGPSDIGQDTGETGLLLDDALPAVLQSDVSQCGAGTTIPCWAYCPTPGVAVADCAVELQTGSGSIVDMAVPLAAGASRLVRVFASVGQAASGTVSNTASVTLPDSGVTELTPTTGNSSTATVEVKVSSDVSVQKTDGSLSAVPGKSHSYTVTVRNDGFIAVDDVRLTDELPLYPDVAAGFVPGTISWQCRAHEGACCNTNSSNCGTLSATTPVLADALLGHGVDLPGQSRVVFTITGTLSPEATGTLSNSASIAMPADFTDPDTDNNSATDDDTVLDPRAALSVDKSLRSLTPGSNGSYTVEYQVLVSNAGPSRVDGAAFSDPLGHGAFTDRRASATWKCEVVQAAGSTACDAASGTGPIETTVDLGAGGQVRFLLTAVTNDRVVGEIGNEASISHSAGNASDSITSALAGSADLLITKTDNRLTAVPGEELEYVIRVENLKGDDVFGATVEDVFPRELEDVSWTCDATTPIPGDLARIDAVGAANSRGAVLATSADGRHVYQIGSTTSTPAAYTLYAYDRNNVPGTGFGAVALLETEVHGVDDSSDGGAVVSGMQQPLDLAISPGGSKLYVLAAGEAAPSIAVFNRVTNPSDPAYGRLSFAGSVSAGLPTGARRIVVAQESLYVSGPGHVAVFQLDPVSALPIHDQDHAAAEAWNPGSLALSPAGDRLFVGASDAPYLRMFAIGAGGGSIPPGRLTEIASITHAAHAGATDLVVGPEGAQVYVSSASAGKLSVVQVGEATLTHDTDYGQAMLDDFAPASDPFSAANRLAVAPDGEHLFLSSRAGFQLVQMYRDTQSGLLEPQAVLTRTTVGSQATDVADHVLVTPDGRHLLVASGTDQGRPLEVFSRRAPDPLFALVEVDRSAELGATGLLAPSDVAVSDDGAHVYAVSLADHSLSVFQRFPSQGMSDDSAGQHLQFVASYVEGEGGVTGLAGANRVRVDGRRVYVSSETGDSLAVFARETDAQSPDYGRLTWLQTLRDGVGGVTALAGALGMALDDQTAHLYVAARFDNAIAVFRETAAGLEFVAEMRGGSNGITGMNGISDLVLSPEGTQLLGVSAESNTLVVFDRQVDSGPGQGLLQFVQSRLAGAERPVSISMPRENADNQHIYIAAENTDELVVMRRVTDPAAVDFGQVQPLFEYSNGSAGLLHMDGPSDVQVSPDGRRVYVTARNSSAVLIFDRDLNTGSATFGGLNLVEVRRDQVDGVDGLDTAYAVAVSQDGRNVYAAGFDDSAIASFAVGSGSSCSAGGSGALSDRVNVGVAGTVEYRIRARIRPDATGILRNRATVSVTEPFKDPDTGNNLAEDETELTPSGDLSVTKTNGQVSVVAGERVSYEVVVRNPGPSNLVNSAASPVTLTDALEAASGFVPESAAWTCLASGSGALELVDLHRDGEPGLEALAGVSGLALVADPDGTGLLGNYLAAASVLDNALTLLRRDPLDGRLLAESRIVQGVGAELGGARAVVASADGRFLYVASRESDTITVLAVRDDGTGHARMDVVDTATGRIGLDQVLHLALSPDGAHLYAAGANDNAIAVFARDATSGALSWLESEQNGVDDPGDSSGVVAGLANVQFLVVSPDGAQLYALSGSGASIAHFDRHPSTGMLSWRAVRSGADFNVALDGASSAVFDAEGEYLYVTATDANRVVVLQRETAAGGSHGSLVFASTVGHGEHGTLGLIGPRRALLSADGQHLYVSAQGGASVAWFVRDPADGGLTYLGQRSNDSAGVDGLGGATGMVLDNALGQLYVAGTLDNALVQFERQADSWCPPSGNGPLLAVPFDIAAGGSISFTIDVDVATTLGDALVNTVSVSAVQDPVAGNNSATDTDVDSSRADLAISKDDGLAEYDGLAGAAALAGDADHLYVAGAGDNAIGIFARDVAALEFAGVVRGGEAGVLGLSAVADLLLSADGDHLYAVSPSGNSVAAFRRDRSNGSLALIAVAQNGVLGVSGISGARALAQSADGRHVYVAGAFSNAIAVFARDADPTSPAYGQLSFRSMVQNGVGGVAGLVAPVALQVSSDGKHVYALAAEGDTLAVFARNPTAGSTGFGNLSFVASHANNANGVTGLGGVRSLWLHPGGAHLYVLGAQDAAIAHFTRDSGTGQLAFVRDVRDGEQGVEGLAGAARLRAGATGDVLYAAGAQDAQITHFGIDAGSGALAYAGSLSNGEPAAGGGRVLGLAGVSDLLVDEASAALFSVAAGDAALVRFARSGDGALAFDQALFDGMGGVAPGDPVTYLIEVENRGPSDVAQARVVDTFPEAFVSVSWKCTGSNGGQCVGTGTGNIDRVVNLPVDGRVVFEATGVVGESATGRLVNTATVAAVGATDPDESNNSATDGDTVLSPAANLVVSIDDGATTAVPGGSIDYTVRVANLGPSYAAGVRIEDALPAALLDVQWSCAATPTAGALEFAGSINVPLSNWRALRISTLGQFAYATGDAAGTGAVAVYQRDPLSGALTVAATYEDGSDGVYGLAGASDIVLTPDERFAYVAGSGSDAIVLFARDAETGLLSFVRSYQDGEFGVEGIGGVRALAISPTGSHLYAAGTLDDALAVFAIDAASGQLSGVGSISQATAGVDGLNGVSRIVLSADGAYLFALSAENESLAVFARNASTGLLAFTDVLLNFELPVDALLGASALHVHADHVLVAATTGNRVSRFSFTPEAGLAYSWSLVTGSDGVSGLSAPRGLAFDPEQARLYVAGAGGLHLFSLLGESPTQLAHYDVASRPELDGVAGLTLAPNRQQLYSWTADAGGALATWARERGSRCALQGARQLDAQLADIAPLGEVRFQVSGRIFANASGTLEYSVEAQPRSAAEEVDPVDNSATDSNLLTPAPDLAISKSDSRATVVAGTPLEWRIDLANAGVSDALAALLADPAPVFPASSAGIVSGSGAWTCAANPPLAAGTRLEGAAVPQLAGVTSTALALDGSRLYAVNPSLGALLVFPRAANGSLGAVQVITDGSELGGKTVIGLAGAAGVAVSPDGGHVLVTGASANSLVVFAIGADASLVPLQTLTAGVNGITGLLGAGPVVISRDGTRVFVAASSATTPRVHALTVFARDADSGLLSQLERISDGQGTFLPDSDVIRNVRALHVSEDGALLYAAAATSRAVSSYAVHADTGKLTYLGALREGVAGISGFIGLRAIVAAPGDRSVYVLGDGAINLLVPQLDGALAGQQRYDGIPQLVQGRALALDASGSRLYLADDAGAVHVFARDWRDGSLDLRQRFAPLEALPAATLLLAPGADLYVASDAPGRLDRLDEQALSRCLSADAAGEAIAAGIDLGVGGWSVFNFAATVHPSARGVLSNTASVAPTDGDDPSPADNAATDSTSITMVADLAVTKQGPAQAIAGERIAYQIAVSNAGPSSALGMRVVDALPPGLRDASWTCQASAGSSCPASGTGSMDMAADLLPGGTLSIVLDAQVAPAFLGTLTNSVALVPESGASDPSVGDQAASSDTQVSAEVNLSLTKSNGVDQVVAGAVTRYRITVANAGPSDAPSAALTDLLPPTLLAASWTCTGTGGASCPASGGGDVDVQIAVPAGGTAELLLDAIVDATAEGTIVNTASVRLLDDAVETAPGDESATDTDTVTMQTDLSVSVLTPVDPYDPAGSIALPVTVRVHNSGPSLARDAGVHIVFSAAVAQSPPSGCVREGDMALRCTLPAIDAGEAVDLQLALSGLPSAPGTFDISATVDARDSDPVAANDTQATSVELMTGADVTVQIDNDSEHLAPGSTVVYVIDVRNIGSLELGGIAVAASVAAQLLDAQWTCIGNGGASCTAAGSGDIADTLSLSRGQSVRYRLTATVDPGLDPNVPTLLAQGAQAMVASGDINMANNTAVDEDVVYHVLFADGFEDAPAAGAAKHAMDRLSTRECAWLAAAASGSCATQYRDGGN